MGTNRRSRRRLAARIFHPNGHNKRQKSSPHHDSSLHSTPSSDDGSTNFTVPADLDSNEEDVIVNNPFDETGDDCLVDHDPNSDHESQSTHPIDKFNAFIDNLNDCDIFFKNDLSRRFYH
jgi:hypothetical protein